MLFAVCAWDATRVWKCSRMRPVGEIKKREEKSISCGGIGCISVFVACLFCGLAESHRASMAVYMYFKVVNSICGPEFFVSSLNSGANPYLSRLFLLQAKMGKWMRRWEEHDSVARKANPHHELLRTKMINLEDCETPLGPLLLSSATMNTEYQ